ncbi:MAG: hypothetical protein IPN69_21870 [Acidobacteria bacterium]|nr:hypothetical protein [Acidobacteriota bacterium]
MGPTIFIIIFVGVILAGIAKYLRTRELSDKLGREVQEHELVSLNSWMEAESESNDNNGKSLAQKPEQSPVKNETMENVVNEDSEQAQQRPNNCPNCGAVLSKGISRCRFCGVHLSRKTLEEHASIFLHDLEKDFDRVIPGFHEHLRLGCFFIPVAALTGTAIAYLLLPDTTTKFVSLIGVSVLSLIVAYIWLNLVDSLLTKKEGVLFHHFIEPKIKHFISENQLEPLEFVNIAKQSLNKYNKLLKHIFLRF